MEADVQTTTADVHMTSLVGLTIMQFKTLEEHNADIASQRLPTVVFLVVLMALGGLGNTVVLLIYGLKYPPSTFRTYILCLASLDVLSCCIAMPLEVVDNTLPLMFFNEEVCKAGRLLENVFKTGSAFVLIVMAVERHRKICNPFSATSSHRRARVLIGVAIGCAVLISWPAAIIEGRKVRQFEGNVTGFDCSIDDDVVHTQYPFIFSTVMFVFYVLTFIILCVLYTRVIIELRAHARQATSMKLNDRVKKMNPRITNLMMALTSAFILCHLPHCILDAGTTFKHEPLFPASPLTLGLLPLLSRTFFITSVVNPLIYLIGDAKFRGICKLYLQLFYHRICCIDGAPRTSFYVHEELPLTDMNDTHQNNHDY